jgi:hydroxymethylpyrimidine kinase/phosphomethylpyrimidine kinase/thiamine-phosphate diphosphorylase
MTSKSKAIVWTIAGSDSSGGAGIQADLLTFSDFGVHGCSVITASTAQNSQNLSQVLALPLDHLQAQLGSLQADMPARAIKIGMLATDEILACIAAFVKQSEVFVVCDPVLKSTSGTLLLSESARQLLLERLLPQVDLLTPNLPEVEQLLQQSVSTREEIEQAAEKILALGCKAVLITGGHSELLKDAPLQQQCADYFSDGTNRYWLLGERINSPHSHGSGCTLSAAIAACMGQGYRLEDAIVLAKSYVSRGIRAAQAVGQGVGAVAHTGWPDQLVDLPRIYKNLPSDSAQGEFASCDNMRLGLYPVVDSVEWLEKLLPLGIQTIQLRIKEKPAAELERQIQAAVALSQTYQTRLFVNDYWQLAIKYGAYGVHLGQEDLDCADLGAIAAAGLRVGISTHSYWEIARAHALSPSYIAIGPIYETTTKKMRFAEQGVGQLAQWVQLLEARYPLVAIGGIDYERAKQVIMTGVGSVAMVSAICQAEDYIAEVTRLLALIESNRDSEHAACTH